MKQTAQVSSYRLRSLINWTLNSWMLLFETRILSYIHDYLMLYPDIYFSTSEATTNFVRLEPEMKHPYCPYVPIWNTDLTSPHCISLFELKAEKATVQKDMQQCMAYSTITDHMEPENSLKRIASFIASIFFWTTRI